jgi:transposase
MARGFKLSEKEKGKIEAFKEEGKSNRWIAAKLSRSPRVINNYTKNPNAYGVKKQSGRPPKLSKREKRKIVRTAANTSKSCNTIRLELNLKVTNETIRKVLKADPNIARRKMKVAPALREEDKPLRLEWARQNMKTDWNTVG